MSSGCTIDQIDLACIQKTLNEIECEDKRKRKSALKDLHGCLQSIRSETLSSPLLDQILKTVLRSFSDSSEACRELAVTILRDVLVSDVDVTDKFALIMPVLTRRLSGSEIVEPSEEVRFLLVELFREVVKKFSLSIFPCYNDIIQILTKTVVDPFPKIKKLSCECIIVVANAIPQHFHMQSESLVKPLLQNLSHQQYKIRVSSIVALGVVVCKGNNKSIKEVSGPLAERLFDQTQQVREAVTEVVGDWLINLPDRYSYFHVMIPLLLSSLNDEAPCVQERAWLLWNQAGKQWEQENEDDIKDKLDFLYQPPTHYPKNLKRPNLGCRMLVKRNLHKISPAVVHELQDWLLDVRLKASQLLCVLILNVEVDVAQYAEQLLQGMYRACGDEDSRVSENVERAAHLMGHFFSCKNYWPLMYPIMQDSCHSAHLCILAALLSGTEFSALVSYLNPIANFLELRDICQSREADYQLQILKCCSAFYDVCGNECSTISRQIFNIVVTVHALASSEAVSNKAQDVLGLLQNVENLQTVDELYKKYMRELFQTVSSHPELWTVHSTERLIFQNIMLHSGPALGGSLDLVIPILSACLHPNNPDAEMKLKVMSSVASVIQNNNKPQSFLQADLEPFLFSLIQDVIAPNLVWKAGRTAEALRTMSVSFLLALLQTHDMKEETIDFLLDSIVPLLIALVEDASRKTRLYACQSLRHVICLSVKSDTLKCDHVHKIYSVLLKRLDDVDDTVRKVAVEVLRKIFTSLPKDYNIDCSSAQIEALFSTLLIHLDDPSVEFGSLILDVLKEISPLNKNYLLQKLSSGQGTFRNQKACEELLHHLTGMLNVSSADETG